jgi:hypothetical protein
MKNVVFMLLLSFLSSFGRTAQKSASQLRNTPSTIGDLAQA